MRSRIGAGRVRYPLILLMIAVMLALTVSILASPSREPAVAPNLAPVAAPGVDMGITALTRIPLNTSFSTGTQFDISITLTNIGIGVGDLASVLVSNDIGGRNLSYVSFTSSLPNNYFTCTAPGNVVSCVNTGSAFGIGATETIIYRVQAAAAGGPFTNSATVFTPGDTNGTNNQANDSVQFVITGATATQSITLSPTITLTPTASLTALPSFTPIPSITPTFTPTFIPAPPTRTPLPRPANAGLAVPIPPSGVDVVVTVPEANVRLVPAIGADLVGTAPAGTLFEDVQARTVDGEWLRVDFFGQQGWIGIPVVAVLAGDISSLPVADPRTIPYGGFENPRAGLTSVTSGLTVRLADSGMRLRAGPSIAYPVFANPPRFSVLPVLGRTANNTWLQVNYEGTLGWIKLSEVMEFNSPDVFTVPPIDGIVAEALPFSDNTFDSFVDTLRLLLARLEIAGNSLNQTRDIWTQIAIGGEAQCGSFPDQPSDFNVPNALLAAFNPELYPIVTDFNTAMGYIRDSIRLLIEACSFPQATDPGAVGVGAASVALEAINNADALFPGIRDRILALLPEDRALTPFECLFQFGNRSQILPRILNLTPIVTFIDSNERVQGFCFDGTAGQTFRLELLRVNGNIAPSFTVSSFRDPTSFIAAGNLPRETDYTSFGSILIPETGQYLIIISDTSTPDGGLQGDLALMLTDLTAFGGSADRGIALDAAGNVITNPNIGVSIPATVLPPGVSAPASCPSLTFTCTQLLTCGEAQACLAAGNASLDPNFNGIPCEENLCTGGTGIIPTPTLEPTA